MRNIILITCIIVTTGACSRVANSSLNPLNWFAGDDPAEASATVQPTEIPPLVPTRYDTVETVDTRALIDQVTSVSINRTSDGVLVTATGRSATIGAFNADLVPTGVENGVFTLMFRAQTPPQPKSGTQQITVARVLSAADLGAVRQIRVQGANNQINQRY